MHIAICDDDRAAVDLISSFVTDWASAREIQVHIDTFPSAEAFLFHYADHKSYDILLLDIEMGELNGVELAKTIRQENDTVQIVFITGYPDFLAEGYEVAALHYLMKPVSSEKLETVLDRARANLQKTKRTIILTADGTTIRVAVDEIQYVEAFSHSVAVVTETKTYDVRMSISDAEKLLGDGFVRCHRSYLVGLKFISHITKTDVTLDNGKVLPISRGAAATVHQAFIAYYRGDNHEAL